MIYAGENKSVLCKGDFRPAQFYKGSTKIAGYERTAFEEKNTVTLTGCYNDKIYDAQIEGETIPDALIVRGKNLFDYIGSGVTNAALVEKLPYGAIVRGSVKDGVNTNAYDRGWFRPGDRATSGVCPVLHTGDVVTVSADVTLMELRADTSYMPYIYIYAREGGGYSPSSNTILSVNETKRISKTFTVTQENDGKTFYPVFTLNSNVVKIENIQMEKEKTATEFEPYITPQTVLFEGGVLSDEIPTFKGTTVIEGNATIKGKYKKRSD